MKQIFDKSKLVIVCPEHNTHWFVQAWRSSGINVVPFYKECNKAVRAIRRVSRKTNIPDKSFWYSNQLKHLHKFETIIVHISMETLEPVFYLRKLYPDKRIIAWYCNVVFNTTNPNLIRDIAEVWSFDQEDCKKHNMKFNHQYYFKTYIPDIMPKPEYDVYFCGVEWGRLDKILNIYDTLNEQGISNKFRIVGESIKSTTSQGRWGTRPIPLDLYSENFISYDQMKTEAYKAKAILEINKTDQTGSTLRQMEAMFFQKKLITDNKNIVNEPYYDPNNIFILGYDNISKLPDFINSSINQINDRTINKYDVINWINNFTKKEKNE